MQVCISLQADNHASTPPLSSSPWPSSRLSGSQCWPVVHHHLLTVLKFTVHASKASVHVSVLSIFCRETSEKTTGNFSRVVWRKHSSVNAPMTLFLLFLLVITVLLTLMAYNCTSHTLPVKCSHSHVLLS